MIRPGPLNTRLANHIVPGNGSVSVEATKFLTYVRTVPATVNDPVNYAINAIPLGTYSKASRTQPPYSLAQLP